MLGMHGLGLEFYEYLLDVRPCGLGASSLIIATTPLRGLSKVPPRYAGRSHAVRDIRYSPLFTNRFEASKSIYSGFYGFVPTRDEQIAASIVKRLLLWSIAVGAVWFSQWRKWSPLRNLTEETEQRPPDGSTHLPYARAVFLALGGYGDCICSP